MGHFGDTGSGGSNGALWPRPRVGAAEPREEPTCAHTRDGGAQLITAISANYSAAGGGQGVGGDAQRGDTAPPPKNKPHNSNSPEISASPPRVGRPRVSATPPLPPPPPAHAVPSESGPVPGRSRCGSARGAALSGTGRRDSGSYGVLGVTGSFGVLWGYGVMRCCGVTESYGSCGVMELWGSMGSWEAVCWWVLRGPVGLWS